MEMYDPKDTRGVPVSAGIPPIIRWSGLIGLVAIFVMVGIVIGASRYGHVWPSPDSARIKLTAQNS
jgi:hypothetical protein